MDAMEYVELKNSDLKVSRLGMGGCPMGGYGWGEVQEEELVDAVHAALDSGITFFDTADTYGLGQSEKTLGNALGTRRKDVFIATKFGVRVENGHTFYDNNPEWIRKACMASLKRLGTDYIDLYQIHYRDGKTPIHDIVETLDSLRASGCVRFYGLSNIYESDKKELEDYKGVFVSFQDEYSLACRKNEEDMISISLSLGLTPITWGSLGQGILTGKYTKETVFSSDDRRSRDVYVNFHGKKLLQNLRIVEELRIIAANHNKSVASCAIRYILDKLAGSVVLAGVKRRSQLESNVEALDWHLSAEEMEALNAVSGNETL